ncbi:hypothetical protein OG874_42515 [Nocardia sp. NBC_00565]|uniref:hypothetical protein n=1 Tax=Nocardia sp. NBC_00565 TaxID=2975993 RepID=UPI002E818D54|nr:hypothetical protein [Nocardia sp. NBC_00565]WUC03264.1 hypothetical protein OG874_42515 [Nocardia sp. NBC_00565]
MKLCDSTAAAILVIGAVTLGAGVSHAEPVDTPARQDITYSVKLVDKTVVASLRGGTFTLSKAVGSELTAGGDGRLVDKDGTLVDKDGKAADIADVVDVVDLADSDGHVVVTLPLQFRVADTEIPVTPVLQKDGTVLELAPQKPAGLDISQPLAVKPVASVVENQRARDEFATQFGLATAVGTFVGTAIGAVVGCVITIVAGCIGGFTVGAAIGGIIGTVIGGSPILVTSGVDYVNTMFAPDGTTRFADKPTTTKPAPTPTLTPAPK